MKEQSKKPGKIREFFSRMFKKLDKNLEEKAKSGRCCCCSTEKKDKSCSS